MNNSKVIGILLAMLFAAATLRAGTVTIPAGTQITVRMVETVDSEKNHAGQTFRAAVDNPIQVDGKMVVPRGAEAIGRLVDVEQAGRLRGSSKIALELTAFNFDGLSVSVQSNTHQEVCSSQGKDTAKVAGGGGLLGAIFGALTGGKKGSVIGAGLGAAGGTVVQAVRGGEQIYIPAESLLLFTLQSPVTVDTGF